MHCRVEKGPPSDCANRPTTVRPANWAILDGLVQPNRPERIQRGILRRHPPPKHHPTLTRHLEQVAIPCRLRGVGAQGAMGAVVVGEVFEVSEQVHSHETRSSVSTTDQPSFMNESIPTSAQRRSARRRRLTPA